MTVFINKVDRAIWQKMEKIACNHPIPSRFLALPLALECFVRDICIAPPTIIETLPLAAKSIKVYQREKTPENREIMEEHIIGSIVAGMLIPLSPLVGLIEAIAAFVNVIFRPFKTAKKFIATTDFNFFVNEKNYQNKRLYIDNRLIDFANEFRFAESSLHRFYQRLKRARTHPEIANIHFLDEENSKQQIINEIVQKNIKFLEAKEIYNAKQADLLQDNARVFPLDLNMDVFKAQEKRLKKVWHEFQHKLINATDEEVAAIVFEPN